MKGRRVDEGQEAWCSPVGERLEGCYDLAIAL